MYVVPENAVFGTKYRIFEKNKTKQKIIELHFYFVNSFCFVFFKLSRFFLVVLFHFSSYCFFFVCYFRFKKRHLSLNNSLPPIVGETTAVVLFFVVGMFLSR